MKYMYDKIIHFIILVLLSLSSNKERVSYEFPKHSLESDPTGILNKNEGSREI